MTLAEFAPMFALLAVQLRQTDADEATIRGYFEALKDLEPEFLAMAATRLAKSAEWFPKTSEWREAARVVELERSKELAELLKRRLEPLCAACRDTGWEPQGDGVRKCACRSQRRLEVLGRRPLPALPPAEELPEPDPSQFEEIKARIAPLVKGMP